MYFVVFSITFSLHIYFSNGELRHNFSTRQSEKGKNVLDNSTIQTKWIKQPVDHFNKTDMRTWDMKYYENLEKWQDGGPIYLFICGENPAVSDFLINGLLYDLADETNGAMFSLEHRYYGKSKPFVDVALTKQNLKFLSSRQALADVAEFIRNKKLAPSFRTSKVVVVGGSYSGNLAAWMRLFYSDLVDAAISSSAPVLAKANFFEFLETVGNNFRNHASEYCNNKINSIFDRLINLFGSENGIEQLKKEQNICSDIDMHRWENQKVFYLHMLYPISNEAQHGNFKGIQSFCNALNMTNDVSILNERQCLDCDYENFVVSLDVAWQYQLCNEFGFFQTSPHSKPFDRIFDVEFYYGLCSTLFGPEFNAAKIEESISKTNELYGGLNPTVTNVVFVNGDLDPWHKLGILRNLSETALAIFIPGASHSNDLLCHPDDSEQLIEARRNIRGIIKRWIGLAGS